MAMVQFYYRKKERRTDMIANGTLFKNLRRDRHLTLTEIASDQISIAAISKFERGLADMTFQRFEYLLGRINVSLEEFLFLRAWHNGEIGQTAMSAYRFNSQIDAAFINRMKQLANLTKQVQPQAVINQLQTEIDQYLRPPVTRKNRFMALGIQFYQTIIRVNRDESEKEAAQRSLTQTLVQVEKIAQPFVSYVYSIENWGYFELLFFLLLHTAIPNATKHQLLPIAVKRSVQYQSFSPIQGLRYDLLFGLFSDFINARQLAWAKEALTLIDQVLKTEHDLTHANRLLFCRGWYTLVAGDEDEGVKTCRQAISIEHILNQPRAAQHYTEILANVRHFRDVPDQGAYFL